MAASGVCTAGAGRCLQERDVRLLWPVPFLEQERVSDSLMSLGARLADDYFNRFEHFAALSAVSEHYAFPAPPTADAQSRESEHLAALKALKVATRRLLDKVVAYLFVAFSRCILTFGCLLSCQTYLVWPTGPSVGAQKSLCMCKVGFYALRPASIPAPALPQRQQRDRRTMSSQASWRWPRLSAKTMTSA
jgi:hypothetical protein